MRQPRDLLAETRQPRDLLAEAEPQPRGDVGAFGGVLRLTGLSGRPQTREDELFARVRSGRSLPADATEPERAEIERRYVERGLAEYLRDVERNGPDESTPAEVEAYLRRRFQEENPTVEQVANRRQGQLNNTHTATGGLTRIPQGFMEMANLSDEGARLDAFLHGTDGDLEAAGERYRLQRLWETEPGAQMGREAIGSLPLFLTPAGQGLRGMVASGGVTGAAIGAGEGETLEERAENALEGGAFGAAGAGGVYGIGSALGRAAKPVGRSLNAFYRGLRNRFGGTGNRETRAQQAAVSRLQQAFADDGIDAAAAEQAMREFVESGFDDATLLDVGGDAVRREVRRAAGTAGPASSRMEQVLDDRVDSQPARVGETISRFISRDRGFRETADQAVQARSNRAAPLYEEFRAQPAIPRAQQGVELSDETARLEAFFENRLFRSIARRSAASASNRSGQPVNLDEAVSPDVLNRIKVTLDEQVATARRSGDATRLGDLTALRERYVGFLDEVYPQYAPARDAYAGDSALIDALNRGRRALREDTEDLAAATAEMTESERQMFQIGIARAVREQAGNRAEGGDVARAILRNPNQQERLRAAFDDDEMFDRFIQALRNESARVRNARAAAASSGSQTAPRASDQIAGGFQDFVQDLLSGNFSGTGSRMVRGVGDVVAGSNRRARDAALVDMATQPLDEAALARVLERVRAEMGPEAAAQLEDILSRLAAPTGAAAATLPAQ